jgi:hypothetical protein
MWPLWGHSNFNNEVVNRYVYSLHSSQDRALSTGTDCALHDHHLIPSLDTNKTAPALRHIQFPTEVHNTQSSLIMEVTKHYCPVVNFHFCGWIKEVTNHCCPAVSFLICSQITEAKNCLCSAVNFNSCSLTQFTITVWMAVDWTGSILIPCTSILRWGSSYS